MQQFKQGLWDPGILNFLLGLHPSLKGIMCWFNFSQVSDGAEKIQPPVFNDLLQVLSKSDYWVAQLRTMRNWRWLCSVQALHCLPPTMRQLRG